MSSESAKSKTPDLNFSSKSLPPKPKLAIATPSSTFPDKPATELSDSSILSAPAQKKFPVLLVIIAALVGSVVLNIILLISVLSKNEYLTQYKSDIEDYKSEIIELKNKINALSGS